MSASVRDQLPVLYADLAAEIAQAAPVCELSGRCCRFVEYGHKLYITRPEAELLLSEGLPPDTVVDEAGCPFQQGGLCTARNRRPLGCRIYFCDPSYQDTMYDLSAKYTARLQDLHRATDTPWEYGALHEFLREADSRRAGLDPPTQLE